MYTMRPCLHATCIYIYKQPRYVNNRAYAARRKGIYYFYI